MINDTMPTEDQISDFIDFAKSHPDTWNLIKRHELQIEKNLADAVAQVLQIDDRDLVLDPQISPTLHEIIAELSKSFFGKNNKLASWAFTVPFRKQARIDLDLPV